MVATNCANQKNAAAERLSKTRVFERGGPVAAGRAAKGAATIPYSRPGLAGIHAWATPGSARNALANVVGRYGQYGGARSGSEVANLLNPAQQQGDVRDRLEPPDQQ